MKELTKTEIEAVVAKGKGGSPRGKRVAAIEPIPEPGARAGAEDRNEGTEDVGGKDGAEGLRMVPMYPRQMAFGRGDNPRHINEASASFLELVQSVAAKGIVTPMLGRPHPTIADAVEILAGHRRFRAAERLQLRVVPVVVRQLTDREALELLVFENFDRVDLTPMEEGRAVAMLLEAGYEAGEIASRMGKSRQWIARRANLLNLTKQWQTIAEDKNVSAAHLELIARYDPQTQARLIPELTDYDFEALFMGPVSLDELRRRLADEMRELMLAPWNLDDTVLDAKAGACSNCPKRSGCQPDLFGDETEGGDRCLDEGCWDGKMEVFKERRVAALRADYPGLIKVAGKGGSYSEARKHKALDEWSYQQSAPKTKDAVPALVITGECEGKLIWVKPNSGNSMNGQAAEKKIKSAAAKQAEASQDPKACEQLLAEKLGGLEQRRTAWVIGRLLELMGESDAPGHPEFADDAGLLSMVVGFGTTDKAWKHCPVEDLGDGDLPHEWSTTGAVGVGVRRAVWEMVKPRIKQALFFDRAGSIGDRHREGCEWLANVLGARLEVIKEQAVEEIPEPKSWEQLRKLAEAPKAKEPKDPKSQGPKNKKGDKAA